MVSDDGRASGTPGHIAPLDGIRAVAVAIVMLSHAGLERIVPGGLGVSAFFFLSGYLITTLMRVEQTRTAAVSLRGFYARRVLRIVPPMWITLTIGLVLTLAGVIEAVNQPGLSAPAVAAQYLFLNNYTDSFGWNGGIASMPIWSLAVEEHYYLAFPLLYIGVLRKLSPARAALLCAGLCAVVLLVRGGHALAGDPLDQLYYWSHTRIDSILAGSCLALYRNPVLDGTAAWRPRRREVAGALLLLAATLVIRDELFRQTLRYSLQSLAFFVLFAAVLQSRGLVARLLAAAPMKRVGDYSYSLYLSHLLLLAVVMQLTGLGRGAGAAIAYPLSFGYAALMFHYVDRPLARVRRALHRGGYRWRGTARCAAA
ncbi:peptidoglycan/LPS O-acetylase OafA/YrhL [Sphingomonas sp. BK235]|nr:peptidoglycan/LPS O-acetylase OafA/YrhL [Sphingomonas sp. BK235]